MFREVEIVNAQGNPIGEFDEIDLKNKVFYEEKSATGLNRVNPRTGLPAQTPQEFSDKQIYQKTKNRIENLKNVADSTRATKNGSQIVPTLDKIKNINKFVFRLEGDTPQLRNAVNNSLNKLRTDYPSYKFDANFGEN